MTSHFFEPVSAGVRMCNRCRMSIMVSKQGTYFGDINESGALFRAYVDGNYPMDDCDAVVEFVRAVAELRKVMDS